jgi:hypothetical protein
LTAYDGLSLPNSNPRSTWDGYYHEFLQQKRGKCASALIAKGCLKAVSEVYSWKLANFRVDMAGSADIRLH